MSAIIMMCEGIKNNFADEKRSGAYRLDPYTYTPIYFDHLSLHFVKNRHAVRGHFNPFCLNYNL